MINPIRDPAFVAHALPKAQAKLTASNDAILRGRGSFEATINALNPQRVRRFDVDYRVTFTPNEVEQLTFARGHAEAALRDANRAAHILGPTLTLMPETAASIRRHRDAAQQLLRRTSNLRSALHTAANKPDPLVIRGGITYGDRSIDPYQLNKMQRRGETFQATWSSIDARPIDEMVADESSYAATHMQARTHAASITAEALATRQDVVNAARTPDGAVAALEHLAHSAAAHHDAARTQLEQALTQFVRRGVKGGPDWIFEDRDYARNLVELTLPDSVASSTASAQAHARAAVDDIKMAQTLVDRADHTDIERYALRAELASAHNAFTYLDHIANRIGLIPYQQRHSPLTMYQLAHRGATMVRDTDGGHGSVHGVHDGIRLMYQVKGRSDWVPSVPPSTFDRTALESTIRDPQVSDQHRVRFTAAHLLDGETVEQDDDALRAILSYVPIGTDDDAVLAALRANRDSVSG